MAQDTETVPSSLENVVTPSAVEDGQANMENAAALAAKLGDMKGIKEASAFPPNDPRLVHDAHIAPADGMS